MNSALDQELLDECGKPVKHFDSSKVIRPDVVASLLAQGANPDCRHPWNDETPLFSVARTGCMAAVNLLLQAGADPTAVNKDGHTAAFTARPLFRHEIINLLEEQEKLWRIRHDATGGFRRNVNGDFRRSGAPVSQGVAPLPRRRVLPRIKGGPRP